MAAESADLLRRLPGCGRLSPDALEALRKASHPRQLEAGARLLGEGEPAPDWYCIVESGALQLSRVDLEGDAILDYLTPGDLLDPGSPGTPVAFSASAVERTRCLLVPQTAVARHRAALTVDAADASRGDLVLFVRRVGDLVRGAPVTCPPATPVSEAARLMVRHGVGSVIVLGPEGPTGIVTDRDLRSKVMAAGLPSETPVSAIMSAPLISIEPDRLAFDALLEMTRRNVHHLGVTQGAGLVGVISGHDLVWLQGAHPVSLARDIEAQDSLEGLAAVAPRLEGVVRWLAGGGARVVDIGRIVAEINDRLVRRAVALTEAGLDGAGRGGPPVPYSWVVAGSEGRREQTLRTDQDNGLVYADPPADLAPEAARYFGRLASEAGAALVRLGFPVCPGGFMASNPRWCQPLAVWRGYFDSWMETPMPEPVLFAALYADMRPVAGSDGPGGALWEWVCERAPGRTLFQRHMAKAAVEHQVPLGLFGRFVVERAGGHRDRLDIKARGVFPMTQAMRVYALSLGLRETNTVERLAEAGARGIFVPTEVAELREAYEVVCRVRLSHQLGRLDAGTAPDNFVDPEALGKSERLLLKEAFKTITWLQRRLRDRFQTDLVG